ncbi:YeeE/YedE family protein [Planoprotostelium fungivorum]|uniref:YeeE/YedE family protein n=1 Tax=Planoprotostelium fungivorum TaxID=1890364 RepID=A0A2P6NB62_9EUKA|nr:YeeE/YedE family protein [Planoprotostelium fungivorum]
MSILPLGLLSGGLFGAGLVVGGVHLPELIQQQMLFRDFSMMKMFLAAVATSSASMVVINTIKPSHSAKPKSTQDLFGVPFGGNIIGGCLLGAGMAVSGTCPGTVYAQVGAGVPGSLWALCGGLLGALIYSQLHPLINNRSGSTPTLHQSTHKTTSHSNVIIGGAATLAAVALALVFPQKGPSAYLPFIGGFMVGASQLFSLLISGVPLGMSSSFVTCTAAAVSSVDASILKKDYLSQFTGALKDKWAVSVAVGAILGGYFVNILSSPSHSLPVSTMSALVGGFLVVFGARCAGGCTSGHGISGVPTGSFSSIVTVAAIFAGGIATSFFIR